MHYAQIVAILLARGVRDPQPAFALRDDGRGPYLAEWDTETLGPQPTADEIDRVSAQDADAALEDEQTARALAVNPLLRAVGLALFARILGRAPTQEEQLALLEDVKAAYRSA